MTWRARVGRFIKLLSPALVDRIARATMQGKQ
jgi:hypothetical protein